MGFKISEGWGGTADFELDGHCFRLQDYYVKDFAENFMVVVSTGDVEAWHRRVREIVDSGEFGDVRVKPSEIVDGKWIVLHGAPRRACYWFLSSPCLNGELTPGDAKHFLSSA